MKYLAILKDSVREALDNKLIYVLVGLSLLVTLFVLSAGFKPLPAADMMARLLKGDIIRPNEFAGGGGPAEPARERQKRQVLERKSGGPKDHRNEAALGIFHVESAEPLQGEAATPDSSYRFTIALPLATKEAADRVRANPAAEVAQLRSSLELAEKFQYFKVNEVHLHAGKGDATATVHFTVTTEPTGGSRLVWGDEYSLFWGAVPLGGGAPLGLVLFISTISVLGIGSWVTLLVSVIVTAFFIPNMLRKGTIDLLLCRPISRPALLSYKYVGGLTFILINTAVAIVGMWLALGLRSGVWANSFLLMIFVYTFFFAILYAASTLFGVLTRSAVVAILLTCGVWFVLFLVSVFYGLGERQRMLEDLAETPAEERTSENGFFKVVRAVHFVLPRTGDLNDLGQKALMHDFMPPKLLEMAPGLERESFHWGESIGVSLGFIVVVLGLSCWLFARKDY
jgi:ABC-type transport system involved in multi-copper enzyme maturation permease subunit